MPASGFLAFGWILGANSNTPPLLLHLSTELNHLCTWLSGRHSQLAAVPGKPTKHSGWVKALKQPKALLCQGNSGSLVGACEKLWPLAPGCWVQGLKECFGGAGFLCTVSTEEHPTPMGPSREQFPHCSQLHQVQILPSCLLSTCCASLLLQHRGLFHTPVSCQILFPLPGMDFSNSLYLIQKRMLQANWILDLKSPFFRCPFLQLLLLPPSFVPYLH